MKTKIQIAIAVLVIIGASFWAYTSLRPISYSGSNIMFPVGAGHVVIRNTGNEVIPIEMRSGERSASFRVASAELGLAQSSRRQGTGREAFHAVSFDLPPGQTRIDVASGRDVQLVTRSETRVDAVVTPVAPGTARWIMVLSGAAILWALYYMSRVTDHRWIGALRNRGTGGTLQPSQQPKQTTT